jgi:hypothetical protein
MAECYAGNVGEGRGDDASRDAGGLGHVVIFLLIRGRKGQKWAATIRQGRCPSCR